MGRILRLFELALFSVSVLATETEQTVTRRNYRRFTRSYARADDVVWAQCRVKSIRRTVGDRGRSNYEQKMTFLNGVVLLEQARDSNGDPDGDTQAWAVVKNLPDRAYENYDRSGGLEIQMKFGMYRFYDEE